MKRLLAALFIGIGMSPAVAAASDGLGAQGSAPAGYLKPIAGQAPRRVLADEQSGQLLEKWGSPKSHAVSGEAAQLPPSHRVDTQLANVETPRRFQQPVGTRTISSRFGLRKHPILGGLRMHSGVDFAAAAGAPIVATSGGVVSRAGWAGGYGLRVTLSHSPSLETRYGHMSRLVVAPGQRVRAGQVLGFVGSTGLSTGPHLHYEVRMRGRAIDPHNFGQVALAPAQARRHGL
jgi:murein DD-endopeptidase MepM/ murein hydrolase activator NlpD